jgi:hypothetical protein
LRYFNSALQARKQMCSYLSLVHESLKRFDLAFWCFETVLRNLTAYQMMRLRWGASQVPVNARNRSSHYPIWGIKSLIGPFPTPQIFRLLSRLRTPLGRYLGGGGYVALLFLPKLHWQPNLGYPFPPPFFLLFGLRSRTPASRSERSFNSVRSFTLVPGDATTRGRQQNINDVNVR